MIDLRDIILSSSHGFVLDEPRIGIKKQQYRFDKRLAVLYVPFRCRYHLLTNICELTMTKE